MKKQERIGLWLVGARGGIGTCVSLGWCLLSRGKCPTFGLVTENPELVPSQFVPWENLVLGGHEIRNVSLYDEALRFAEENRTFDKDVVREVAEDLQVIDSRIRWGTISGADAVIKNLAAAEVPVDASPLAAIQRLLSELTNFRDSYDLSRVVVVHIASTEASVTLSDIPTTWPELEQKLGSADAPPLPPSSLYAIAAFLAGCTYINFTPSLGPNLPALHDLAILHKSCYMGCDGKTGETLLKSVLAPMFRAKNLHVSSWVGHNIFGNLDGRILDNPQHKASKVGTKDRVVNQVLGYHPQTLVTIEYIEGLGDWKTAWDHIQFRGFLGVPMVLQFIWQGCDSLLAAPLVLDLCRLAERAQRAEVVGTMPFLASFFKSPYGVEEGSFFRQYEALVNWATSLAKER